MILSRAKKAIPSLLYGLLAVFIMGPLLRPGYIFLLDYVVGPHIFFNINPIHVNSIPVDLLIRTLSYLVTPMVAQKLIIFLILFIAGLAMYYSAPVRKTWACYFAGFLYVVNPFVFARLQAGHIGLLIVYALTPLVATALFKFLSKPERRTAVIAGAWLAVAAMTALHGLYLFLVLGVGIVVHLWFNRSNREYLTILFRSLAVLLLTFAILSVFWLIPAMLLKSPVAGIDSRQIAEFATQTDQRAGVFLNVAAMNGFWQTEIFESKNAVPSWPFLFLILFALAVWGLAIGVGNKEKRATTLIVGLTAVIAFILALGVASPATAWLYRLLFENVSAFRGFREPQKFVGLLAFGYAYLGSLGVDDLMRRIRGQSKNISGRLLPKLLAGAFITVVVIYTWPMFWGLGGHAKSVDYPRSWYRAEEIMSDDPAPGAVLFLPWRLYMPMSFNDAGKVVANPAPHFFKRDVIYGKNAELHGIRSTSTDIQQKKFEDILASGNRGKAIAEKLRTEGMRYVVLTKDADWTAYQWLYSQRGLKNIYGAREIAVFLVTQ